MKTVMRILSAILPALISSPAVAAATGSFSHEIEVFLSTSVGNIVFILLLLLVMMWLLLPLAVFGLKRKLREIIRQNTETNRLLAEIRDELGTIGEDETAAAYSAQTKRSADPNMVDLYDQIRFDP